MIGGAQVRTTGEIAIPSGWDRTGSMSPTLKPKPVKNARLSRAHFLSFSGDSQTARWPLVERSVEGWRRWVNRHRLVPKGLPWGQYARPVSQYVMIDPSVAAAQRWASLSRSPQIMMYVAVPNSVRLTKTSMQERIDPLSHDRMRNRLTERSYESVNSLPSVLQSATLPDPIG
jgi:hypothetical protein